MWIGELTRWASALRADVEAVSMIDATSTHFPNLFTIIQGSAKQCNTC